MTTAKTALRGRPAKYTVEKIKSLLAISKKRNMSLAKVCSMLNLNRVSLYVAMARNGLAVGQGFLTK